LNISYKFVVNKKLKIMDRRDFLKKGFVYSFAGSMMATASGFMSKVFGQTNNNPDLVAVRGADLVTMYKRGIEEIGGMSRFVKQGQRVVVKPNIAWDVSPERAGNTNPELVKAIIESCYDAGAREVLAFDHTCDNWQRTYENSGIADAVEAAGGRILPGNEERYFQEVDIPGGKTLTKAKVHELILESDLYINVPVLKHHGGATLTVAMKNLMGVVWDRGYYHRNDLHQCIADFCLFEPKPTLNIVDAYYVMTQNGPRGTSTSDLTTMESLLISPNMVAIDSACAQLYGADPRDIGHMRIADELGIGKIDLGEYKVERIYL